MLGNDREVAGNVVHTALQSAAGSQCLCCVVQVILQLNREHLHILSVRKERNRCQPRIFCLNEIRREREKERERERLRDTV